MTLKTRILLSSACALTAVLAFSAYAREIRADAERARAEAIAEYGGEVVELAVATRTIEAGEVLAASDVRMSEWLYDLAPEGALTSVDELVGSSLSAPIAKGAPLTSLNFREETDSADVPKGHVAVVIPISDKLGISREVARGTKVVAFEVGDESSKIIAQNAVVLATPSQASSSLTASQTMTIAVLPDCVSDILLASTAGTLRIVLPAQDLADLDAQESEVAPSEVESIEVKQEESAATTSEEMQAEATTIEEKQDE